MIDTDKLNFLVILNPHSDQCLKPLIGTVIFDNSINCHSVSHQNHHFLEIDAFYSDPNNRDAVSTLIHLSIAYAHIAGIVDLSSSNEAKQALGFRNNSTDKQ